MQIAEEKITYIIANSIDIASTQHIKPNLSIAFYLTDWGTLVFNQQFL